MAASSPELVSSAVPAVAKMMLTHGAAEVSDTWSAANKRQAQVARKRALLALVEAGGEPARRLALAAGAHEEWLLPPEEAAVPDA